MKPAKTFVLGYALRTTGETAYFVGFPIFLWHFMIETSQFSSGFIADILALSFFIMAIMEVVSSHAADSLGFTRRKVFLLGFLLMLAGFAILALFPFWIHSEWSVLLAYGLMRVIYSFGIAFISGTFDGWAVSLETASNPDFNKSEMFTDAYYLSRVTSFLVGGLIILFLFLFEFDVLSKAYKAHFWVLVWVVAAFSSFAAFTFLKFQTKDSHVIESEKESPPFFELIKVAFSRDYFHMFSICNLSYLVGKLITWTWPILLLPVAKQPYVYLFVVVLLVVAMPASKFAKKLSRSTQEGDQIYVVKKYFSIASVIFIGIGFFLYSYNIENAFVSILLVLVLSVGVFFAQIVRPFVNSFLHENIKAIEQSRSTIISLREAVLSLVVSVFFLVMSSLIDRFQFEASEGAALSLIVIPVVVLLFLLTLKKPKTSV